MPAIVVFVASSVEDACCSLLSQTVSETCLQQVSIVFAAVPAGCHQAEAVSAAAGRPRLDAHGSLDVAAARLPAAQQQGGFPATAAQPLEQGQASDGLKSRLAAHFT